MIPTLTSGMVLFQDQDDDTGFRSWIERNPEGYFINTERGVNRNYLLLHRATCPTIKGRQNLTRDYVKFCSLDRAELEDWATA